MRSFLGDLGYWAVMAFCAVGAAGNALIVVIFTGYLFGWWGR